MRKVLLWLLQGLAIGIAGALLSLAVTYLVFVFGVLLLYFFLYIVPLP
jgi:hypothetical protein